jgi:pimeloyl-ACP methyl ester carboxylesterase
VAATPSQEEMVAAAPSATAPSPPPSPPPSPVPSSRPRTLLIGHSLGGALTARMAVRHAVRGAGRSGSGLRTSPGSGSGSVSGSVSGSSSGWSIGGLVLVAPALIAPARASAATLAESETTAARSLSPARRGVRNLTIALRTAAVTAVKPLQLLLGALVGAVGALCAAVALVVLPLCISLLVHSPTFWRNGVGAAYGDAAKLSESMINRYRWPSQVRGSAAGVARFVVAQAGAFGAQARARWSGGSRGRADGEALGVNGPAPADAEVVAMLASSGVPVLIVHGELDRIVPLSNSRALAARLAEGGCDVRLVEMAGCGHCPQEEAPEQLGSTIAEFARTHGLVDK